MDLLAAEILAVTGRDPGEHYQELEERSVKAWYARKDASSRLRERLSWETSHRNRWRLGSWLATRSSHPN